MKNLIKKFILALVLLLSVALVGCVDPDEEDGGEIPEWQKEEITLKFATWAYTNPEEESIDTLLIDAFTEKYPNITVEMQIIEGIENVWDSNLLTLTETEDGLPDVFVLSRLENLLPYGILADLTEFYENDPDTQYIFENVRDLGLYNGKRYVIPTYIYPQFWVVNKDLLEANNVVIPGYDWTWEQMEEIAKAVSDDTTHTIGIYGTAQYFYEFPKVIENKTNPNNNWLACGFDGTKFNFNSNSFMTAMSTMENAIKEGYLVNEIDDETATAWYGSAVDPRYSGHVAIWREPAYQFKGHLDEITFDFDIYPAPSGVGMGNTDIAGVSALSKHKEAAYQLLKWMSYSKEGIIERYKIYEEYSEDLAISGNNYPYPIADYGMEGDGSNAIWDNITYGNTAPGLVDPLYTEALRNGALQANKEVIGWDSVIDNVFWEYFGLVLQGEADYASQVSALQTGADQALAQRRKAVEDMINAK